MRVRTAILTAVLGLGLTNATVHSKPYTNADFATVAALCQEIGNISDYHTQLRNLGVSRAKAGQGLLQNKNMQALKRESPSLHAYLWKIHTEIYNDTERYLTPAVMQTITENHCVSFYQNMMAQ